MSVLQFVAAKVAPAFRHVPIAIAQDGIFIVIKWQLSKHFLAMERSNTLVPVAKKVSLLCWFSSCDWLVTRKGRWLLGYLWRLQGDILYFVSIWAGEIWSTMLQHDLRTRRTKLGLCLHTWDKDYLLLSYSWARVRIIYSNSNGKSDSGSFTTTAKSIIVKYCHGTDQPTSSDAW